MNVESLVDEIEAILESGKTVPFTSNLLVDAEEIKRVIEDIRLNMPDELMQARKIVSERKEILTAAQNSADAILEGGRKRAKELVAQDEITKAAEANAAELLQQAQKRAQDIVEQARQSAQEITNQAKRWSADMRQSAGKYVESIVTTADEALTNSVNEIRRAHNQLRAASGSGKSEE